MEAITSPRNKRKKGEWGSGNLEMWDTSPAHLEPIPKPTTAKTYVTFPSLKDTPNTPHNSNTGEDLSMRVSYE